MPYGLASESHVFIVMHHVRQVLGNERRVGGSMHGVSFPNSLIQTIFRSNRHCNTSCIVSRTRCTASKSCCLNIFVCCLCFQQHPFYFYHGHWLCSTMERNICDIIELRAIILEGFKQFLSLLHELFMISI